MALQQDIAHNIMTVPLMTYYTRTIDAITGEQILGWASTAKNQQLYYGKLNAITGGESPYIVELDIWNSEPSWSAGTPMQVCQNAENCKLTIDIPVSSREINPFFYVRCITDDPKIDWTDMSMGKTEFTGLKGVLSTDVGQIYGNGDHCQIQTKIKLKPGLIVNNRQYAFNLNFEYNYE